MPQHLVNSQTIRQYMAEAEFIHDLDTHFSLFLHRDKEANNPKFLLLEKLEGNSGYEPVPSSKKGFYPVFVSHKEVRARHKKIVEKRQKGTQYAEQHVKKVAPPYMPLVGEAGPTKVHKIEVYRTLYYPMNMGPTTFAEAKEEAEKRLFELGSSNFPFKCEEEIYIDNRRVYYENYQVEGRDYWKTQEAKA